MLKSICEPSPLDSKGPSWTRWTDNSHTSLLSRREIGSQCVRTRWLPGNYGSGTFEYTMMWKQNLNL
jgi:hypothetical protein